MIHHFGSYYTRTMVRSVLTQWFTLFAEKFSLLWTLTSLSRTHTRRESLSVSHTLSLSFCEQKQTNKRVGCCCYCALHFHVYAIGLFHCCAFASLPLHTLFFCSHFTQWPFTFDSISFLQSNFHRLSIIIQSKMTIIWHDRCLYLLMNQ